MLLDLPRLSLCVFDTCAILQQPISFALIVEPMAWLLLLHRLESCSHGRTLCALRGMPADEASGALAHVARVGMQ